MIWPHMVMEAIKAMAEASAEGLGIEMRINTDGGDPQDSAGLMAKFQAYEGEKTVTVDGRAYSTGFFMCLYANKVEALDVSNFMIHRAGHSEWFEASDAFTDQRKNNLNSINSNLERAFRNRCDVKLFEQMKGVKVKDLFDLEKPRQDIFLTAIEAKKIGLVDKIIKITPQKKANVNASMEAISAHYIGGQTYDIDDNEPTTAHDQNDKIKSIMKRDELMASHPALFAMIIAEGKTQGVKEENDRVGAWLVNIDVDPAAVKAGINSGENLTQTAIAEFGVKRQTVTAQATLEAESPDGLDKDGNKIIVEAEEKTPLAILSAQIDTKMKIGESVK